MKDIGYVVLYDCPVAGQKSVTLAAAVYNGSGMDITDLDNARKHAKELKELEPTLKNVRVCRLIEIEQ
jgi:hypothetical protein